ALAPVDPHRLGPVDLPARGDPAGQRPDRPLGEGGGSRLAFDEPALLPFDQRVDVRPLSGPAQRHRASYPTIAGTPRLKSWSATITRWISEVPSQIRSTRSSRKNRSATFSRMYPRPPKICTARSATRPAISLAYSLASEHCACWV